MYIYKCVYKYIYIYIYICICCCFRGQPKARYVKGVKSPLSRGFVDQGLPRSNIYIYVYILVLVPKRALEPIPRDNFLVDLCSVFQTGAVGQALGPNFGRKPAKNIKKTYIYIYIYILLLLPHFQEWISFGSSG